MIAPKILRALFIHGVGEQENDFSDEARRRLRQACHDRGTSLYPLNVHWAPLADRPQQRFLKSVKALGSNDNMTQRLVIGTLSDALMYCTNAEFRKQIFALMDQQVWMLGGKDFTIFAHSLGGLIATDYLRARPHITGVRMVTMGCNLGLFTLGQSFKPVQALCASEWHNLYSGRDMLGFPLSVDPGLTHVQDLEVSVGGWFKGWTGLAHIRYWDDAKLWEKTIPRLLFDQ
jgi:pimeloyl-ACP methyl ester carboxylesterase